MMWKAENCLMIENPIYDDKKIQHASVTTIREYCHPAPSTVSEIFMEPKSTQELYENADIKLEANNHPSVSFFSCMKKSVKKEKERSVRKSHRSSSFYTPSEISRLHWALCYAKISRTLWIFIKILYDSGKWMNLYAFEQILCIFIS